jgi:GST-like protein
LFWQESSASFLGGGFGHFYKYAPYPMEYPINRYAMETKRQLDVLDRHLAGRETMCASGYSIADIAIWPWYGRLALGEVYDAAEFLDTASYEHVLRWARHVQEREAVQKGLAAAR